MNKISYESILHTISNHKFNNDVIEQFNNQQNSIALFMFENLMTSLFKDIKYITSENINNIVNKLNKFIDLFHLNLKNHGFDDLSKRCCCYYLFNIYINSKKIFSIKEIYNVIQNDNIENLSNLVTYIWNEQSILNIYNFKDETNDNLIITKIDENLENENYDLIYDFIINLFMYNVHIMIPNYINTIGMSINPIKNYIKTIDNKSLKYDDFLIFNNLKDQYMILYDSDMDYNYINYLFENEDLSLNRFINSFLQIYRATIVANSLFNFQHGNLKSNHIYVKNLKTKINIKEHESISEISKKFGYNYKYQEVEDIILITNFNNSKINIKKDGTDYKLKKISSNIGNIYTLSQDILLILTDLFVESKNRKFNDLYNILYHILSKFFEDPNDLKKINCLPYNIYNKKEEPIFSFKNINNFDIYEHFFEYLNLKSIDIHSHLKSTKTGLIYPDELNITSFFKYNNINLYNNILVEKNEKTNFITKIHTKEYENIKLKIIETIKNIKIYEYLKLTLSSSGLNDSIYEEICILSNLLLDYFKNLKLFIYYSFSIFNKINKDDISKILITEHTLSTLYFIYYTLDKEAWSNNKNILNIFNITDYSLKEDTLSYIYSMLD